MSNNKTKKERKQKKEGKKGRTRHLGFNEDETNGAIPQI